MVRRPDPCIYSQAELASDPQQVRWQNPHIRVLKDGNPVQSLFGLLPGAAYTAEAGVRNCSPDVAAHNTAVQLFLAPFGIGGWTVGLTAMTPAPSFVSLPPATGVPVAAVWVSASASAALLARVTHPDDANGGNNEGWHIVRLDERPPGAPGSPIFPIWNPFSGMRFIKVFIVEEGAEEWFPQHEITIGRADQILPVGVLPDQPHIIDGHLVGLALDIPDDASVGVSHTSHLTAYALPSLDGPRALIGGVTYIVRII